MANHLKLRNRICTRQYWKVANVTIGTSAVHVFFIQEFPNEIARLKRDCIRFSGIQRRPAMHRKIQQLYGFQAIKHAIAIQPDPQEIIDLRVSPSHSHEMTNRPLFLRLSGFN